MILYITTYENTDIIAECVENAKQTVLEAIQENRFNFSEFVRKRLDQLKSVSHILIDLQALVDTDEEIVNAIKGLRLVYDDKRIIIFASGKNKREPLLAQIFALGVYDIVTGEITADLEKELEYCLTTGKNFRDSLIFQVPEVEKIEKAKKEVVEKIIVKNEIVTKISNAVIGIMGTQHRCGVTHHTIVSANYLKSKGFSIAVLECSENPVLETYARIYGHEFKDSCFLHEKVAYYPRFDLNQISQIYSKNYDIILIDFGVVRQEIIDEYYRCMMRIVVSGSEPYEVDATNFIFETFEESVLSEISFVFQSAGKFLRKMIQENMEGGKLFFAPLVVDPFSITQDEEIIKLYAPFVKSGNLEKKQKRGWLKKWVG